MSKQAYRQGMARFFAIKGRDVEVTDDGRVIVDGRDRTNEIDAEYATGVGDLLYVPPAAN